MASNQLEKDGLWKEHLHGLTTIEDSVETMNCHSILLREW